MGDLVAASDRRTVALQLMDTLSTALAGRSFSWTSCSERVGDKAQYECYPDYIPESEGGALATHRDTTPGEPYSESFTMTDVLFSSLDLDDLSPLYTTFVCDDEADHGSERWRIGDGLTRRQDFGEIFSAVYTHRGVVCAGCHNSAFE